MTRVDHMLRLVVWGNMRADRWDHADFVEQGATFVSRCQVPGYALYKMFGVPTAAPCEHARLDAELYAVSPECLYWADEKMLPGMDRVCVLAHMFNKDLPKEPWHERTVTGMQCAWLHFLSHPVSKGATRLGYIYDLPNENFERLKYKREFGSHI